jgi:hypothetical protein
MIKKIRAVYVDENGKKTDDCLVVELYFNAKGQMDFKEKSEVFGFFKDTNEDSGQLEMSPFVAVSVNDYLLVDFGDTWGELSKSEMETSIKPRFIRYCHILTKDLDPKVGGSIIMMHSGQKFPYQIARVEDYK